MKTRVRPGNISAVLLLVLAMATGDAIFSAARTSAGAAVALTAEQAPASLWLGHAQMSSSAPNSRAGLDARTADGTHTRLSQSDSAAAIWKDALVSGDLSSSSHWGQDSTTSHDELFYMLSAEPHDVDWGRTFVTGRKRIQDQNGQPAYLITAHITFAFDDSGAVDATVLSVRQKNGQWRLQNTAALESAAWVAQRVGPLSVLAPKGAALGPQWQDAAHFADSLAQAYGVVLPEPGIPVIAAPSIAQLFGINKTDKTVDIVAFTEFSPYRIIVPLGARDDSPGYLRHELTHYITAAALSFNEPSWGVGEGVATYYGGGYGCPSREAFLREMAETQEPDSMVVQPGGLLRGLLMVAMADKEGGAKRVMAVLQVDAAATEAGRDVPDMASDSSIASILKVPARTLDVSLSAFGQAEGRRLLEGRPETRLKANAACRKEPFWKRVQLAVRRQL